MVAIFAKGTMLFDLKTILKQIDVDANKQIERYSMQCGFHKPINTDQLRLWLKMKGIVY